MYRQKDGYIEYRDRHIDRNMNIKIERWIYRQIDSYYVYVSLWREKYLHRFNIG